MSVIRQDPTTKEWVILASERSKRPHDATGRSVPGAAHHHEVSCPFCPGNEQMTPGEIWRVPADQRAPWLVRVVPNKFAALTPRDNLTRRDEQALFREMDGVGFHEVIIETPQHDRFLALMSVKEVERILLAYQLRYLDLEQDPRIRYIILFKNHGERAGTSLDHPHSQIVATPIAPVLLRRKYQVAMAHYDDTGRCLYRDIVEAELRIKTRLIVETDRYVVFHPFASRAPFETWIVPKSRQPSFGELTAEDRRDLALVLLQVLRALDRLLGSPAFNYVVHSAPAEDADRPYYLWHIQILPRVATIAGFELGSGIFVTTMLPEESAASMRGVLAEFK